MGITLKPYGPFAEQVMGIYHTIAEQKLFSKWGFKVLIDLDVWGWDIADLVTCSECGTLMISPNYAIEDSQGKKIFILISPVLERDGKVFLDLSLNQLRGQKDFLKKRNINGEILLITLLPLTETEIKRLEEKEIKFLYLESLKGLKKSLKGALDSISKN